MGRQVRTPAVATLDTGLGRLAVALVRGVTGVPVEVELLELLARRCDAIFLWTVFYDPEFVARNTIDQNAYTLLHEALHVVLRHCAVMKKLIGDRPTKEILDIANIAVDQFRLPGFAIEAQLARHYPMGELFAHSIGYIGSISEDELHNLDPVNAPIYFLLCCSFIVIIFFLCYFDLIYFIFSVLYF